MDTPHGACATKLFDLHTANQSQIAQQALNYMGELYAIERDAKGLAVDDRWRVRQQRTKPIAQELHVWMVVQRSRGIWMMVLCLSIITTSSRRSDRST